MEKVQKLLTGVLLSALVAGCDNGGGSSSFQTLTSEIALSVLSAECAFGGVTSQSGPDRNRNGALDADEVFMTQTTCNDADSGAVDEALKAVILDAGLTGDPAAGRDIPTIDDPLAQLGMQLFFSKALSGDQDTACVSCHHPFLGGSDELTLPIGVAAEFPDLLGKGRTHSSIAHGFDGGPTVPRNSPTTFNLALWDQVLFHDGRIESATKIAGTNGADGQTRTPDVPFGQIDPAMPPSLAAAQARSPVTSPEEMR